MTRTLHLVKRNVKDYSHYKTANKTKQIDFSFRIVVRYLHKIGYYGRAARRKLDQKSRIEKIRLIMLLGILGQLIFFDESKSALFSDIGQMWV